MYMFSFSLWEPSSLLVDCWSVSFQCGWQLRIVSLISINVCTIYTIASIVAVFGTVLVPCIFVSLIRTVFVFLTTAFLFPIISSISAYQCNHDVLVIYYWVFVETVIIFLIVGLVIIVIIVAMFYKLLKCLTSDWSSSPICKLTVWVIYVDLCLPNIMWVDKMLLYTSCDWSCMTVCKSIGLQTPSWFIT